MIRYDHGLSPIGFEPHLAAQAALLGVQSVDETITSFLMIVSLGAAVGIVGGVIALFFLGVLWSNIEEVPDETDGETGAN